VAGSGEARFSEGSVYDHKGRINFVDVDKATGAVLVRTTLPNPDHQRLRRN
jgi:membrane fusion protein, multidrug efflux system